MALFQPSVLKKHLKQQDKSTVDKAYKEIDKMVYELYGLTDEEIKIVEYN